MPVAAKNAAFCFAHLGVLGCSPYRQEKSFCSSKLALKPLSLPARLNCNYYPPKKEKSQKKLIFFLLKICYDKKAL